MKIGDELQVFGEAAEEQNMAAYPSCIKAESDRGSAEVLTFIRSVMQT